MKLEDIKLSREDKLLLFLYQYEEYRGLNEVPLDITQEGIGRRFDMRQSNVSYLLKVLKERKWLEEDNYYILHSNRRRKAYFLTGQGIREVKQLLDKYDNMEIEMAGGLISVLDARTAEGKSMLDFVEGGEVTTVKKPKYMDYSDLIPSIHYFFGRHDEMEEIELWLTDPESKALMVFGMAGIGKTTLLSKSINDFMDMQYVFWYRLHEWSTIRSLLERLAEFLRQNERPSLQSYLSSGSNIEIENAIEHLRRDMDGLQCLMVFDDVQKASANIVHFFRSLVEFSEFLDGPKLIYSGREIPYIYDRKQVVLKKLINEIRLKGLDKNSSSELLEDRGIKLDSEQFKRVYSLTQGHPLSLELLQYSGGNIQDSDIKRYLQEEVLEALSKQERRAVEIASIYRYPVYPEAFFMEGTVGYDLLDSLVNRSLLQVSEEGLYDLHDLIREFFYQRMAPEEKVKNHRSAAQYYQAQDNLFSSLEAQYHLLKGKNMDQAAELAVRYGLQLINHGYLEEFLAVLVELTKDALIRNRAKLLMLIGDIYTIWSNWDDAIENYEEALKIAGGDIKDLAKAHMNIGKVYWRKGYSDTALLHLKDGIKHADELGAESLKGQFSLYIGNVYWGLGEIEKAIESYNSGLEIFKKLKDEYWMTRVFNNLGTAYHQKNQFKQAADYLEQCIKLARNIGDIRYVGYGLSNAAEVYINLDQIETAKKYASEAMDIFERLNEKTMIANTFIVYGIIARADGNFDDAEHYFNKSIIISKELKHLDMLAQGYFNSGLLFKEEGMVKEAKKHFEEAIKLYMNLRNTTALHKSQIELRDLLNV